MTENKPNFGVSSKRTNMASFYSDYMMHPSEPKRSKTSGKELNLNLRLWLQNKHQLKQQILKKRQPNRITL